MTITKMSDISRAVAVAYESSDSLEQSVESVVRQVGPLSPNDISIVNGMWFAINHYEAIRMIKA